jgi:hypothetical protein
MLLLDLGGICVYLSIFTLQEKGYDHINVDSLYLGNESSLFLFLYSSFSSNAIQLIDANSANGSFSSVLLISVKLKKNVMS